MNYVVLDFETTGLDYKVEQIIEVALIKYDENFKEIGSFNSLVQLEEGRELSDFIKELTGIDESMLVNGIPEKVAMETIKGYIDPETIVVAQYAPFDFAYLSKYGIYPEKFICTKSLTSQVEPTESSSLIPTCERLGIELKDAHRAFADVRATAELLQYRLEENKAEYVENYIVKSPDRDLAFVPRGTIEVLNKEDFIKTDIERLREIGSLSTYVGGFGAGDASTRDLVKEINSILYSGKVVHEEFENGGRWSNYETKVYEMKDENETAYFLVMEERPATELQEGMECRYEFYEVEPYEVTVTKYRGV